MADLKLKNDLDRAWYYPPGSFFLWVYYFIFGIFTMAACRLLFTIYHGDFSQSLDLWNLSYAFFVGARFDQIILLGILAPLTLALPFWNLKSKFAKRISTYWITLTLSLVMLIALIDLRFFDFFRLRLNNLAYDYLSEGNTGWDLVFTDKALISGMSLWFIASVIWFILIKKISNRATQREDRSTLTGRIIFTLLLVILSAWGMRGRLGTSPLSWSAAYFSDDDFINEMALNPVYTLAKSYAEEEHDPRLVYLDETERYPFVPFAEGLKLVQDLVAQPGDRFIEPDSSLLRLTRQPDAGFGFKPNIVLILMESWCGELTGALGGDSLTTPFFDKIAKQGIFFNNFRANGHRTNFGVAATLGSFPAMPGRPILKRYNANHPFVTLSEILKTRGYTNIFSYGGDLMFDNMEGFLAQKKYDQIWGIEDFPAELQFSKWGVPDSPLYDETIKRFNEIERPFFATVLSVSNHEPFEIPDHEINIGLEDGSEIDALKYADQSLERILNDSNIPLDSTIFVFISDHALFKVGEFYVDPVRNHIPLLIYSPALLGDRSIVIDVFGSQIDLIPTLMSLLGGDYIHASWGRNLFAIDSSDGGYALTCIYNRITYLDKNYYYAEHIGIDSIFTRYPTSNTDPIKYDSLRLIQNRLRTITQIADQLSTPSAIK